MPNKKYFSYIRVSTQRQGQHGTSLAEQQAAIERFARSWNLAITKRFEERQSAARNGGRTVFLNLIRELKRKTLHFQLDTRKPEPVPVRSTGGSPGRRATLEELVAERLNARPLPAGVERARLVAKGIHYLKEAEESIGASLSVVES